MYNLTPSPISVEKLYDNQTWIHGDPNVRDINLTIFIITIEDEQLLFNDKDAMACADRLHKLGVGEVVIKMGEDGCFVSAGKINEMVPLSEIRQSQDTTGAGDSFNGAYLAARLAGKDCVAAASIAHLIAREVIMHPGAIIPKNAMPEVKP